MFLHPELNSKNFPSDPQIIIRDLAIANDSNEKQKDTRYLSSLLMQMKRVHARMPRHILRLKTLIAGMDWNIVPFDDSDEEKAELAKRRLKNCYNLFVDNYLDGYLYGVSLIEIDWEFSSIGFKPILQKN